LSGEPGEELRQFLHDSVKSFEELEALLFLARHPDQDFSAEAVTATLGATVGSIDEALEELARVGELVNMTRAGMVRVYRYAPRDESIRRRVAELEAAYNERRMTIVQMLSANALERVRRAAMRRLADAFRIERGKK
jgi:acetolactate synthase small subunit